MWKLVFGGWCRHIYAYWLQFSEFLEINSPVKSKSALATSGNWKLKNTDNNPAFRTVLTWQRVQLTPTRQRSALKSRPRSCEMTFRGQTYRHQSGRDLRVKTRVSTFSPQIDEFGGRLASLYYNSAQSLMVLLNGPPLSNFVDRGLGEWEWLGPGSTKIRSWSSKMGPVRCHTTQRRFYHWNPFYTTRARFDIGVRFHTTRPSSDL
jgi:hypothetical protein